MIKTNLVAHSLFGWPVGEVLGVTLFYLISVAYATVSERKTMASMQRRVGPNVVGFFGSLQAFADALKLLLKEYIAPSQANPILFFFGPVLTLTFSLLVIAVIPFGPGIAIYNTNLSILLLLALSSIATYGILLAGWSANSKYAFLGSLRSTAQLISYELILTSAILIVVFFTGSLNLNINVEAQKAIWFFIPLLPAFIIFFISSIAETNRAPFDLAEAESELVSGFMTEHSSVVFVFFFLAEYGSIVFMCILVSILFLGGYLYYIDIPFFKQVYNEIYNFVELIPYRIIKYYDIMKLIILDILSLAVKATIFVFVFIWVRASFPRIRYDQLMSYCWLILLPIVIAFIIYTPCISYVGEILPFSASLLGFIPFKNKLNGDTAKNTAIRKSFNITKTYVIITCKLLMPVIFVMFMRLSLELLSIYYDLVIQGTLDSPLFIVAGMEAMLFSEMTGTETGTGHSGETSTTTTTGGGTTSGGTTSGGSTSGGTTSGGGTTEGGTTGGSTTGGDATTGAPDYHNNPNSHPQAAPWVNYPKGFWDGYGPAEDKGTDEWRARKGKLFVFGGDRFYWV